MANARIFGILGVRQEGFYHEGWVPPWADQRIRHQERLSVASVLSMLSEDVRKFVRADLFAKIRLTNGRLAEYYHSLVACVSEEVPTGFHCLDGHKRKCV